MKQLKLVGVELIRTETLCSKTVIKSRVHLKPTRENLKLTGLGPVRLESVKSLSDIQHKISIRFTYR